MIQKPNLSPYVVADVILQFTLSSALMVIGMVLGYQLAVRAALKQASPPVDQCYQCCAYQPPIRTGMRTWPLISL